MNEGKSSLYVYADILGYRNYLSQHFLTDIKALHNATREFLDEECQRLNKESAENRKYSEADLPVTDAFGRKDGYFGYFFAFDTIILYYRDVPDDDLARFGFALFRIAALLYLFLFIRHSLLLRGVMRVTKDAWFTTNDVVIREIPELYEIEKSIRFACIYIDIRDFTVEQNKWHLYQETGPWDDLFWYHENPFKEASPLSAGGPFPLLSPLTVYTVNRITALGWSFYQALERLDRETKRVSNDAVAVKLRDTHRFLSGQAARFDAADPIAYLAAKIGRPDFTVPKVP